MVYQYSIQADTLNGALAPRSLHNAIVAAGIPASCVFSFDDAMSVETEEDLSVDQKAVLDATVASHDGAWGPDD